MDNNVIEKLLDGNIRFVNCQSNVKVTKTKRELLATKGQKPYAIVATCSDSRVSPEYVFDAGIGEIFVIRNAGNIISDLEVSSIEFALDTFECPLILILGHTNCGAIDATINNNCTIDISAITEAISNSINADMDANMATKQNVIGGINKCLKSDYIKNAISNNKTKIIGGIYDTYTGVVEFMNIVNED